MARKSVHLIASVMTLSSLLITYGVAPVLAIRVKSTSTRAAILGDSDRDRFMRRVYEAQVKRAVDEGRLPIDDLREAMLEVVAGAHKMRRDAAEQCILLLNQARSDLRRQKGEGNQEALKVSDIGVFSAYRSVKHDTAAWHSAFNQHLKATKNERAKLRGGEYGDEALKMMVMIMRRFKAAPGFSRHTSGVAVDFKTTEDNRTLTADSNQNALWKKTWFHKWLVKNARKFKFRPLATEAWHWEYSK
jgi:hypothetical protein